MKIDEYKYIEVKDCTHEGFTACLNRLALQGWRPIWKTLKEKHSPGKYEGRERIESINFKCYLFRVKTPTRENLQEQQTIQEEEGVNQYPMTIFENTCIDTCISKDFMAEEVEV